MERVVWQLDGRRRKRRGRAHGAQRQPVEKLVAAGLFDARREQPPGAIKREGDDGLPFQMDALGTA